MAATFTAPHPPSVFRYLKQAFRDYQATGAAGSINVTTPPTHTAASATVVAGTVEVDTVAGVAMPATVTVILTQSATTKGTQSAAVNPTTGAYTTSFPGGTCAAGTATATVSSTAPAESTTTPAFTLT
jgi:hypothetical protein